jgi:hypothetical protein
MSTLTDRILVRIDSQSQGAVRELDRLQKETQKTSDAFDRMSKKIGVTGSTLKVGLATAAAALGGGFLLAAKQSVDAFGDAAKAAGELATVAGSTPETISRMTAALEDSGVAAEKSAALLTKFTVNFSKNLDTLKALNVDLAQGPQGQIDYATTMVRAIDAIDALGDAAERNRASVALFGKAGAAAFNELRASGVTLAQAMEAIDKHRVFTTDDVRRAVQFDDAMDSMAASLQGLEFSLGRALIPLVSTFGDVISTALDAVNPLLDVLAQIPPDVYLVAGSFLVLNKALGTMLAVQAGEALTRAAASLQFMAVTGTLATSAVSGLKGAWTALSAAVAANPVGVALLSLTATYGALSFASSQLKSAAEEALPAMQKLKDAGMEASAALDQTALGLTQTEGFWSRVGAGFRGMDSIGDFFSGLVSDTQALENQTRGYAEALEEAERNMGAFGVASARASEGVKDVKDAAVDFIRNTGGARVAFDNLVTSAGEANEAAFITAQATSAAEQAMGLYAVSIQQVVDWQGKLAGQTATVEEALNNIQESYQTLVTDKEGKRFWQKITDDVQTFGNESEIAMSNAKVAIFDYVDALAAIPGTTNTEIVADLTKLKEKTPGDIDTIINEVIASIEGKPSEVVLPLTLRPEMSYNGKTYPAGFVGPIPIEAEMAAGRLPLTQKVNVTTAVDPKSLSVSKSKLDALAKDRHATVYVTVKPQGQSVADIVGQPGGNMMAPAAASYSNAYSTRFDLRGSTFEVSDPAAMYRELNRMAARRKMAGRR